MSLHPVRYSYASGFKTRGAAESAIEDAYGEGEISLCEDPIVESYISVSGKRAYRISLIDTSLLALNK